MVLTREDMVTKWHILEVLYLHGGISNEGMTDYEITKHISNLNDRGRFVHSALQEMLQKGHIAKGKGKRKKHEVLVYKFSPAFLKRLETEQVSSVFDLLTEKQIERYNHIADYHHKIFTPSL